MPWQERAAHGNLWTEDSQITGPRVPIGVKCESGDARKCRDCGNDEWCEFWSGAMLCDVNLFV